MAKTGAFTTPPCKELIYLCRYSFKTRADMVGTKGQGSLVSGLD